MRTLQGIAVSPGVAIGEALVLDDERIRVWRRFVTSEAADSEMQRLDRALASVAAEIDGNRQAVSERLGDQYAAIFAAHLSMLQDPRLKQQLTRCIREQNFAAEYAVSQVLQAYAKVFRELGNAYMAERAHDVFDIERSLLRHLLGRRRREAISPESPSILLAHDLTPGETARLSSDSVLAFATEVGGPGGHTAIVAKAQEIPAVVGIGEFLGEVSDGDTLIVDGDSGRVVVNPDHETLEEFRQEREKHRRQVEQLQVIRDLPAETSDGARIQLNANIEFPHEVDTCLERGADGVGLYRTEFLYLSSDADPTEQEHYEAYARVVRSMKGRPVVIRTLDLGADKMGRLPRAEEEHNPFLGLRSIRLSLRNLPLFRIQLRAVLRASTLGPVRLMFPLISTLDELRQAKRVLAEVMDDLRKEGVEYDEQLPVGMMVEVPSAVVLMDRFVREVDFLSIGTNDLVQYALAVDRSNKEVAAMYQNGNPAVLRLIRETVRAADDAAVPVSACGQMSGQPIYALLLLGLGVRSLSVPPSALLEIKKLCRSVSMAECVSIAEQALTMDTAREVDACLLEELKRIVPSLVFS